MSSQACKIARKGKFGWCDKVCRSFRGKSVHAEPEPDVRLAYGRCCSFALSHVNLAGGECGWRLTSM